MIARWREPARISGRRQGIEWPAPRGVEVDAAEHGGEFGGGPFQARGGRVGPAEGADLKSLDAGITMPSFWWRYTNSVRSICSESMRRMAPLLAWGAALGNDQLRVPSADPGVLTGRQLSQTLKLILVRPDDQMLPRRRPS